jgi:hypothetical protein
MSLEPIPPQGTTPWYAWLTTFRQSIIDALGGKLGSAHEADTTAVHGIADTSVLVVTSDGRLTDARTPTAHAATHTDGGSDEITVTEAQVTGLTAALGSKIPTSEKGAALGVPTLDAGGQIPAGQIPAVAITEFLGTVANQAAMLALTGQKGDWAIRSDTSTVFVITGADPTILAGWTELQYPASAVVSVNGDTGAVVLTAADVGAATTAQGALADSAVQPGDLGTAAAANVGDFDAAGTGAAQAAAVKGLPVGLAGAVSATRYVGATASVAPVSGTFAVGDFITTHDGKVIICTAAGTPGTWTQVGASSGVSIGQSRAIALVIGA